MYATCAAAMCVGESRAKSELPFVCSRFIFHAVPEDSLPASHNRDRLLLPSLSEYLRCFFIIAHDSRRGSLTRAVVVGVGEVRLFVVSFSRFGWSSLLLARKEIRFVSTIALSHRKDND